VLIFKIETGRFEAYYNLNRHHIRFLFHILNLPAKKSFFAGAVCIAALPVASSVERANV